MVLWNVPTGKLERILRFGFERAEGQGPYGVADVDLAYDYAYEAALIDMRNLHHNTGDGLHMASLAGSWIRPIEF